MGRKKQKFQIDENGKYYKIVNGEKKYYEPLKLVDFFYDLGYKFLSSVDEVEDLKSE